MKDFEFTKCAVCGADDTDKICERGQFGLPTHLVLCKNCGLGYLNPRWTKERYIHFYTKEYDKYYRPEVYKTEQGLGKINYYLPVYERLTNFGTDTGKIKRVLDIGSGDGNNLNYLMQQIPNAKYYAIEPSEQCRNTLSSMGVNILGTDVDINFHKDYKGAFDLIIMRHVLEHFSNPVDTMQKVRHILKDDGIAYIAVPNNLKFGNGKLLDNWFRVVHTYYFTTHSLQNVFNLAGIEALSMQEGDDYNQRELFAIVRKGEVKDAVYNNEFYKQQKTLFDNKLKGERAIVPRLKRVLKRALGK